MPTTSESDLLTAKLKEEYRRLDEERLLLTINLTAAQATALAVVLSGELRHHPDAIFLRSMIELIVSSLTASSFLQHFIVTVAQQSISPTAPEVSKTPERIQ